jgi:hypothetical protein
MQPRHALRASALALALITTTFGAPSLAQRSPHGARRPDTHACVHFTSQPGAGGRSIEFELDNQCSTAVEGVVSWRVACEGESSGAHQEHREPLQPGERRAFSASADACGARSFSIDDVHWSWRQQSGES